MTQSKCKCKGKNMVSYQVKGVLTINVEKGGVTEMEKEKKPLSFWVRLALDILKVIAGALVGTQL